MKKIILPSIAFLVASTLGATSALADLIILKTGEKVRTQGKFEIRDRIVVYKNIRGHVVSLKTADVDLEATETANKPPEPAKEEKVERESGQAALARAAATERDRDSSYSITQNTMLTFADVAGIFGMRGSPELTEAGREKLLSLAIHVRANIKHLMQQYDLDDNPEGVAAGLRGLAGKVNGWADIEGDPAVQEQLEEMAEQLERVADRRGGGTWFTDSVRALAGERRARAFGC